MPLSLRFCFVLRLATLINNAAAAEINHYLYHTEEAAGVIIDYENEPENANPDFLYGANQGPRVVGTSVIEAYAAPLVGPPYISHLPPPFSILRFTCSTSEYYAPWCPHCQHFRSHYIKFAEQVSAVLKEYGGPPVQFYAVSCTANKKLCAAQGVHGYPKIKLYAAGVKQNATAEIMYWKLHAFDVLGALKIQVPRLRLDASSDGNVDEVAKGVTKSQKIPSNLHHHYRTKQQVFDDAHLSFDFNLRNGIFVTEGPLSDDSKLALRDWLELVKQTTPVVWQIHSVIDAILTDFNAAISTEDTLLAILDAHPINTNSWSPACSKGVSGMGYTCGLWQLFHIMSVGLVEYNLMIASTDDIVLKEISIATTHAAETLRNFIEHFFACDVCRRNFLFAYDACELDRCSRLTAKDRNSEQWILYPVWLFETHNAVNGRLLRERADRENRVANPQEVVASQWPSKVVCPKCWLDTGGWNEDAVYKYLRTEYW